MIAARDCDRVVR